MTWPVLESLPYAQHLQPFTGELEMDGDHTEVHLDGAELDEAQASGTRFSESAITGVTFTGGDFDHVRLNDVWISRCRWIGGNWAESQLLDVQIMDSVLAGVQSYRAYWRRVVVQGCKVDSLNLRAAKLQDVVFRDCDLSEVDFGDATLINVTFPGSAIRRARFGKVTTKKVDFRGARELDVAQGWESLRGVTIDGGQLAEVAPALALAMGIAVSG
ncbi:pentapeptide repeat-containing protein [Actinoplanes sp. NPDC026619]|uniref:pentapeptide repeat-containing protein n=1 Tax=Actinoplanes sp. NPDC026619 TaxID=3155798 RepID=UPI0033C284C5